MGAVITFPEARRGLRAPPTQEADAEATVIILPVIRIERGDEAPADAAARDEAPRDTDAHTKSQSPRKRRRRASRP